MKGFVSRLFWEISATNNDRRAAMFSIHTSRRQHAIHGRLRIALFTLSVHGFKLTAATLKVLLSVLVLM
jgi:hypothetical protein